ncbi:MAG TPA: hypothetical protein VFK33_05605 [Bacillales bacterium]|nr:hypothetical protein [Bacillales bacterium]
MSFYGSYHWNGPSHRQVQEGERQQGQGSGFQGHGGAGIQGSGMGAQTPGSMYGSSMPFSQGSSIQGPGSAQGYPYINPASLNPEVSPETLYMMQMIANIGNHLNQLTQMMEKNYQMLHSTYDNQLDTKCVQGSGGGTVIVRM